MSSYSDYSERKIISDFVSYSVNLISSIGIKINNSLEAKIINPKLKKISDYIYVFKRNVFNLIEGNYGYIEGSNDIKFEISFEERVYKHAIVYLKGFLELFIIYVDY